MLRELFLSCTTASLVLGLSTNEASASYTTSIGSDVGSGVEKVCPQNHALIGLELKYGSGGVGRLRGICRTISGDLRWSGSTKYTSWTSTSGNTQFTAATICPTNTIAIGFYGRTTANNMRGISLSCKSPAHGGGTRGDPRPSPYKGKPGVNTSSTNNCPGNDVGRGFYSRGDSVVHKFALICGATGFVGQATRLYKISSSKVGELEALKTAAERTGFRFGCEMVTGVPGVRCYNNIWNLGINPPPPTPASASFDFFTGNGCLARGWSVANVNVHSSCSMAKEDPPGPSYRVRINCRGNFNAGVSTITLKGPPGFRWQDAFSCRR